VQTCCEDGLVHTVPVEPGVQVQGWQAPAPRHALRAAQGLAVYPSPSALQTRRLLTSAHDALPGVQTQLAHTPALQVWLAPHAALV
jgi:hypothetical protein